MSQYVYIGISISTVIIVVLTIFLHRTTTKILHLSFVALRNELRDALETVLSGNMAVAEPINPMQLLMMDLIKSKMNPRKPSIEDLTEQTRDESGKFA